VVFVERAVEEPIHITDAAVEWAQVRLRPQHALASAAIPVVFPTVRVAGRIFTDGSVRQNTPIAPAIRLGCGRSSSSASGQIRGPIGASLGAAGCREQRTLSSPLYLFGKVLDALLLDHVENDLANLRRVNSALRALNPAVLAEQPVALALVAAGGGLRPVRDLFIRPSQDLSRLAAEVLLRPAVPGKVERTRRLSHAPSGRVGGRDERALRPAQLPAVRRRVRPRVCSLSGSGMRAPTATNWRRSSPTPDGGLDDAYAKGDRRHERSVLRGGALPYRPRTRYRHASSQSKRATDILSSETQT